MSFRKIHAMILAAGQSSRMGEPKLMLPYGDGVILDAVIEAVLESTVDDLVIVGTPQIADWLDCELPEDCIVATNDDPESEMLASVQIGLCRVQAEFSASSADGVIVLLGDQPQVSGGTITTCAESFRLPRNPPGILIATYRGRRGHPTIFQTGLLEEIKDWPDDRKLDDLTQAHPELVRELPITSGPMPLDVNTMEDYERLCSGRGENRGSRRIRRT